MREREKEERERKIDREKEGIIEEKREEKERKVLYRKEVKGKAEKDLKKETEEGRRGFMKINEN